MRKRLRRLGFASPSSPSSPADFPDLCMWHDASDAASILQADNIGFVSTLLDKSGNANDVISSDTAAQPKTGTEQINGLNAISFDGIDDALIKTNLALTPSITLMMVANIVEITDHFNSIVAYGDVAFSKSFDIAAGNDIKYLARFISFGLTVPPPVDQVESFVDLVGINILVTYLLDNVTGIITVRINGTEVTNTDPGVYNVALPTGEDFHIGRNRANTSWMNMKLGENIIYKRVLMLNELSMLESALMLKWDISFLPTNFIPTDIDDCVLWLDAADQATIIDSGGFVSQWNDKSEVGNNVTQFTGSSQPLTGVNTINGRNAIAFDGVNDFMRRGSFITSPNMTLFIVANVISSASGFSSVLSLAALALIRDFQIDASFSTLFRARFRSENLGATNPPFSALNLSGTPFLINYRLSDNDSNVVLRVNGVQSDEDTYNGALFPDLVLLLGSDRSGIRLLEVDIGQVVIYNRDLPLSEMVEVETYLSNRFGIPPSPVFPFLFSKDFSSDFA